MNSLKKSFITILGTTKVPHEGFKGSPIALIESSFGIASLPIAHTW